MADTPALTDDRSLQPVPLNLAPGPQYAAHTRLFQGIPGIAWVAPDQLYATWYTGGTTENEFNHVVLARSTDNGLTWTEPLLVIDPPDRTRAYDPTLWMDPAGRLWLFWSQVWYTHSIWDGRAGVWAATCPDPAAAHPTWSAPRRIADGVMMNKPVIGHHGEWLLPVSIWNIEPFLPGTEGRRGAGCVRSTDHGHTFTFLGASVMPGCIFDEHHILPRQDGTLWLASRTREGIGEATSRDGGVTWTPGEVHGLYCPNSRFNLTRLRSGRLLLVNHQPSNDPPERRQWRGRHHLAAYLSTDDGRTWLSELLLDPRHAVSYPDADQAPDGTIYIIYDRNRTTDREILLATCTEDDILAGRPVSRHCRLQHLISRGAPHTP